MGPVKRALSGSAAGIYAVDKTQAADLPVKARAVVVLCIVAIATAQMASGFGPFIFGVGSNGAGHTGGGNTRTAIAPFSFNSRAPMSMDLRTQTEYGTLRSCADWFGYVATNQLAAISTGNTRAFIQFAGFTAGRLLSFCDLYFQGTYPSSAGRVGQRPPA